MDNNQSQVSVLTPTSNDLDKKRNHLKELVLKTAILKLDIIKKVVQMKTKHSVQHDDAKQINFIKSKLTKL